MNTPDYLFKIQSNNIDIRNINPLLIHAIQHHSSDIYISSNDFIRGDIFGKKRIISNLKMGEKDMEAVLAYLTDNSSAQSILNSGKPINDIYIIREDADNMRDPNAKSIYLRFRVNIVPIKLDNSIGYDITLRSIPKNPPLLNYYETPREMIDIFRSPDGIVLVVGPTGSGKSTLLAGFIMDILKDERMSVRIISYESPIEFTYTFVPQPNSFIKQTSVPDMLPTFDLAVEESLRRKPEHIFIGEMRDVPTITNACQAAMTGHLVYSTLHANNVASTIQRIAGKYPEGERTSIISDLISNTRMIVSQRLLPTIHGKRTAIREYLILNDDMRYLLYQETDPTKLTFLLNKMVFEKGVSFAVHARQRFKEGLINEQEFKRQTMGSNIDIKLLDKRIDELREQKNIMFAMPNEKEDFLK